MALGVTDFDCQVYINDRRLQNGDEGDDIREPTALTGLSIDWGRDTTVDQPGTSSCTFDVLTSGARGAAARRQRTNYVIDPRGTNVNSTSTGYRPIGAGVGFNSGHPAPYYLPGKIVVASSPYFYRNTTNANTRTYMTLSSTTEFPSEFAIEAGEWLSGSVSVLGTGLSIGRRARMRLVILSDDVEVASFTGPSVTLRGDEWRRVGATGLYFGPPANGWRIEFGILDGDFQPNGVANRIWFTTALVEKADDVYAYFDGSLAASASSDYAWLGTPSRSQSIATPLDPWLFTGARVDVAARGVRYNDTSNYAVNPGFVNANARNRVLQVLAQTPTSTTIGPGGRQGLDVQGVDGYAIRIPAGVEQPLGSLTAFITPDATSSVPDAWSELPTIGTNPGSETWSGGVWIKAPKGTRISLRMATFGSATGSNANWFGSVSTVTAPDNTWNYYERSATAPSGGANRYVGLMINVAADAWGETQARTWEEMRAPTGVWTWTAGALVGVPWNDARLVNNTQEISIDTLGLYATPTSATQVYVYSGRVTSLVESWDDTLNAPVTKVTCHDFNAELENLDVGDVPWFREGWRTRYGRVMAASGMNSVIRVIYPSSTLPNTIQVRSRDVDSQPAGTLLGELVTSVDGVQWSATDRVTGPYLLIEDPGARLTQEQIFHGTPIQSQTRWNYAFNTRGVAGAGNWYVLNGTGGSETLTFGTSVDGPQIEDGSRITTHVRSTIVTPKTGGNSGVYFRSDPGEGGVTGQRMTLAMWVRASIATTVVPNAQLRNGTTVVTTATGDPVDLAAGVWTRISITVLSTGTFNNFQLLAMIPGGTILPAGTTVDATGMLAERTAELRPFFDGEMTSSIWEMSYDWNGAPFASYSMRRYWLRNADVEELDACRVLREPVQWTQDTQDVSTRVSVTWTDEINGEGEDTDRVAQVVDTAAEAVYGKRRISISSQLITEPDALNVANRVLNRVRVLDWRARTLSIDASVVNNDPETPTSFADVFLTLLNGTQRNGLPLALTNLPDWVPVSANGVGVYLEGGKYTHDYGIWILDLTVSNALGAGSSPAAVVQNATAKRTTITNGGAADAGADD